MNLRAVRTAIWPAALSVFVGAHVLALGSGSGDVRVLGVLAGVTLGILIALEHWLPHRPDWSARGDPQLRNDIAHTLLGGAIGNVSIDVALIVATAALLPRDTRGVWPRAWPLPAQVVLFLFAADGLYYWKHRLLHHVGWLWRIHALHHSAERLHTLKATRSHFLEAILRAFLIVAPLAALGAPPEVVVWYSASIVIIVPISHANIAMPVPAWLHRWVQTPDWHRLHHSTDPALTDCNFASLFPFWDLVFGTYRDPERETLDSVGNNAGPSPPSRLLAQLWYPFTTRRG